MTETPKWEYEAGETETDDILGMSDEEAEDALKKDLDPEPTDKQMGYLGDGVFARNH
jgi:hypothetical protein